MSNATTIAKMLLEIQAVTLNVQSPFRYTSGILSPIYCDNRLIISYPEQRKQIINAFLTLINELQLEFDIVAGTATAGIPHAAWLADHLDKPMVYVRSKSKAHGKQNQIEGKLAKGQTALVVEDLISTGGSSIDAGLALRKAGAQVTDCVAIFTYNLKSAEQRFTQANIKSHTLTDFNTLLDVATSLGYINDMEREQALQWNQDPMKWEEAMGYAKS